MGSLWDGHITLKEKLRSFLKIYCFKIHVHVSLTSIRENGTTAPDAVCLVGVTLDCVTLFAQQAIQKNIFYFFLFFLQLPAILGSLFSFLF